MKSVRYVSSYGIIDAVCVIFSYMYSLVNLRGKEVRRDSKLFYFDSASSALYNFLRHFGRNGGVVLPAYTCIEVVRAIIKSGCKPIFVDVDELTGLMCVDDLTCLMHDRGLNIKAIIATHIYGAPCEIDTIVNNARRKNIIIIEDCAQAWRTSHKFKRLGEWGDVAIFSTGRGKTIDLGGGGYLLVNNMKYALNAFSQGSENLYLNLLDVIKVFIFSRQIWSVVYGNMLKIKYFYFRTWFWDSIESNFNSTRGFVHRSNPLIFMRKLLQERVDTNQMMQARIAKAFLYRNNLKTQNNLLVPVINFCDQSICPHSYPILVANRDALFVHLRKFGYDCPTGFTYSAGYVIEGKIYTRSQNFSERILLLPLHSKIDSRDVINISSIINKFLEDQIGV